MANNTLSGILPSTDLTNGYYLRITETATQSISSTTNVTVTFGSSDSSSSTIGSLSSNTVTFNGRYRLLVTAVYNAGNAIGTTAQTIIIRHRLNGADITNGAVFSAAAGTGDINVLTISFILDVVSGDAFTVQADASVSSVRFASGVPNFPCKSVLFTRLT